MHLCARMEPLVALGAQACLHCIKGTGISDKRNCPELISEHTCATNIKHAIPSSIPGQKVYHNASWLCRAALQDAPTHHRSFAYESAVPAGFTSSVFQVLSMSMSLSHS